MKIMIHQRPSLLVPTAPADTFAAPMPDVRKLSMAAAAGKATRFLARHLRTKALSAHEPRPLVSFSFDDVPLSACTVGARILEQRGVRGTYYVAGGGCGTSSPCGLLASPEHLSALWERGHELGCHTYNHPAVSSIGLHQLRADLDRNLALLSSVQVTIAVRNFAYPYGDLTFRAKQYLQGRFDSCRSLVHGVNKGAIDLGALKSICLVDASLDRAQIDALVAETVRERGWLIFAGHDVDETPSEFGATPALLDYAVAAAQAAGCTIVTVADALKAMTRPQSAPVPP